MQLNPALGVKRGGDATPLRETDAGDAKRAARAYWWTFWLFLAAFGIGLGWDRAWHATHTFQDFYSPPHIFIYATFALSGLSLARIVLTPALRSWFGDGGPSIAVFSLDVPAPLALACAGYVIIAVGGLLDDYWHTTFGLDETGWSTPHAMLGWGIMLALLGLISTRLALRKHIDLSKPALVLLALLALSLASKTPLGPLDGRGTKELVERIAAVPVLARDAAAQHAFRIAEQWNLTRTNPIFVPLATLAAGFGLALTHRFTRGGWVFVLVVGLATLFAMSSNHRAAAYFHVAADNRNWLPLPLLPAALTYMLGRRVTKREHWSWAAAGVVFAVLVALWWGAGGLWVLPAVPAMALGAVAGAWLYSALESPTASQVRALAVITFATPFALGCIDLWLRHHTA